MQQGEVTAFPRDKLKDYLAHSYIYYALGETAISDGEFDKLCSEINEVWPLLGGPYKKFLKKYKDSYPVKGLSILPYNYPKEIIAYAHVLLKNQENLKEETEHA